MKLKQLTFLLALVALPVACDKPEEEGNNNQKPVEVVGEVSLTTEAEVVVGADGATLNITFSATQAWSASCTADWVAIDPSKGEAGTVTLKATVAPNQGYDDRTATVTLTCDSASKDVKIVQKQKNALVLAPETIQVPAEGKDLEIKLQANVDVTAAPDANWITELTTKALTERTFNFTVAPNTDYEPRTGHIVFSSEAGRETITVEQAAAQKPSDPQELTCWDFSEMAWQSAFAQLGEPKAELADVNLTVNNLTISAAAKCKYGENYFQMPGAGSTEKNYFKFGVGCEGVVTVTQSHTGSTAPDPERYVKVINNGTEATVVGSMASTTIKECQFAVTQGEVYVTQTGGMRIYKIEFTVGGTIDPGTDPGDDPVPGENAELDCPNPPTVGTVDMTALTGYAESVTGGANGKTLHFNSGKALQTWLLARTKSEKAGDHSAVTIWLSGTFKPDDGRDFSEAHPWFDVKDVSNLSFIGTDGFVMDRIGIFCVRAKNIVIRNINFQQPKANNGADAVSLQECDGVWVDHCTFTSLNQTKDYEDGSTDITHGSKNVTVSWCRYIKTQKSCLVGHSNSATGDAAITATFHHNWFDNSSSRHPRVRYGRAHVYNNLFDGCTTYGAGSAYGAKVLVEYNYFDGVQLPTDICTYPAKESNESNLQGSVAGYLWATQDILVNRPAKAKDPYPLTNIKYTKYGGTAGTPLTYADFKPSYSYTVTAAEDVPSVVKAGAGYGKLGFTEAPVAVDNGGITEFNGTDDDPATPDTGDEDDPADPGQDTGAAHVYTICMSDSHAVVKTVDGVEGGSYFTCSESYADFRTASASSYNGPFTIGETTYQYGFKMDSKGYVTFTTSTEYNSTLQFWYARRKEADTTAAMQWGPTDGEATVLDVTPFDTYADSGEIALEKGVSYTVKQKTKEQGLILLIVKETE